MGFEWGTQNRTSPSPRNSCAFSALTLLYAHTLMHPWYSKKKKKLFWSLFLKVDKSPIFTCQPKIHNNQQILFTFNVQDSMEIMEKIQLNKMPPLVSIRLHSLREIKRTQLDLY